MNRNAAINDGGLIVSDGLLQMDCQDVPNGTGEDLNAIEVSSITTDQQFQTVTETNDNYTFFDYSEVRPLGFEMVSCVTHSVFHITLGGD